MKDLNDILTIETDKILELESKIRVTKEQVLEVIHERIDAIFYNFETIEEVTYRVSNSMSKAQVFVTSINGKKTLHRLCPEHLGDKEEILSSFLIEINVKYTELYFAAQLAEDPLNHLSNFKKIDIQSIHTYKRADFN